MREAQLVEMKSLFFLQMRLRRVEKESKCTNSYSLGQVFTFMGNLLKHILCPVWTIIVA